MSSEPRPTSSGRVDGLDAFVDRLRAAGARVLERFDASEFGRFRCVLDPEDHLLERWEPSA